MNADYEAYRRSVIDTVARWLAHANSGDWDGKIPFTDIERLIGLAATSRAPCEQ